MINKFRTPKSKPKTETIWVHPFCRGGLLTFVSEWPHSHAVCSLLRKLGPKWKIKSLKNNRFLTHRFRNSVKSLSLSRGLLIFVEIQKFNASHLFFTSSKKWANGVRAVTFLYRCENSPPAKVIKSVGFLTSMLHSLQATCKKCLPSAAVCSVLLRFFIYFCYEASSRSSSASSSSSSWFPLSSSSLSFRFVISYRYLILVSHPGILYRYPMSPPALQCCSAAFLSFHELPRCGPVLASVISSGIVVVTSTSNSINYINQRSAWC